MGVSCGELSLMLFVFNGGFYSTTPTRCSIPLTISAVGVLVSYAGGGSVALF